MAITCDSRQSIAALEARLQPILDKAFEDKTIEDSEMEGFFKVVAESVNAQKYCCADAENSLKRYQALGNKAYTMYVERESKLPQTLEIVRRSPEAASGLRAILKESESDLQYPLSYPEGFLKPNWERLAAGLSLGFLLGSMTAFLSGRFVLRQATSLLGAVRVGGPLGLVAAGGIFLWNLSSDMSEAASLKIPSATDSKESVGQVY